MAKLSKAKRSKLPAKEFAGPNRSYPITDAKHAKAAIMLSNKPAAEGQGASIRARARAFLRSH